MPHGGRPALISNFVILIQFGRIRNEIDGGHTGFIAHLTGLKGATAPATSGKPHRLAQHAALDVLPRDQLTVVNLVFFGGLSRAVIAQRAKLPFGTAKTRLRLSRFRGCAVSRMMPE
jgi:hypothetical protein